MTAVFPPAAAALALLAVVAGAAAWWLFVFLRQLPLERALRAKQAELETARTLAARLFDASAYSQRPAHALAETAGRALDELHRLYPGLAFAALARLPDGRASMLAHRGGAWARVPLAALRFDAGFLSRAAADGEASWELARAGGASGDPLAEALAVLGYSAASARGWNGEEGAGALVALQGAPGPELALAVYR